MTSCADTGASHTFAPRCATALATVVGHSKEAGVDRRIFSSSPRSSVGSIPHEGASQ
jgi:hypothetical protein